MLPANLQWSDRSAAAGEVRRRGYRGAIVGAAIEKSCEPWALSHGPLPFDKPPSVGGFARAAASFAKG